MPLKQFKNEAIQQQDREKEKKKNLAVCFALKNQKIWPHCSHTGHSYDGTGLPRPSQPVPITQLDVFAFISGPFHAHVPCLSPLGV